MKIFSFLKLAKKDSKKRDSKQEALLRNGREQFKTLVKKGMNVPVVFL